MTQVQPKADKHHDKSNQLEQIKHIGTTINYPNKNSFIMDATQRTRKATRNKVKKKNDE